MSAHIDSSKAPFSHFTSLFRYYTVLQFSAPSSRFLPLILGVYSSLQIASYLIPVDETRNAPWNYSIFWPVWLCLNVLARPDQLLLYLSVPVDTILVCIIVVLAARLLTFAACVFYLHLQTRRQYRQFLQEKHSFFWGRRLFALDKVCLLLFTWVMWRPTVGFLSEALSCSSPSVCFTSPWSQVLVVPLLLLSSVTILLDRLGTCDVQWKQAGVSLSSPQQRFSITVIDLSTCILLSFFTFKDHQNYLLLFALMLGLMKFVYIYRELPYHQEILNVEGALQGVLLIILSILLWISVFLDKSGLMPSMSLFFLIPTAAIYIKLHIKRLLKVVISAPIFTDWQRELHLRAQIMTKNSADLNPQKLGLWTKTSKLPALVCSAYFYLHESDTFTCKILISRINAVSRDLIYAIPTFVCLERLIIQVESNPEDKILRDFIELIHQKTKVIALDYNSTKALKRFYEKLLHRHVSFHNLVVCAQSMTKTLQTTIQMYRKILSVFKEKKSLMQAYCSLLEILGRTNEAAKCHFLLAKITSAPLKQHIIEGVKFLQTEDPRSVLFLISSQGSDSGTILWTENVGCLEYVENALEGCDFEVVIPQGFRQKHKEIFARFAEDGEKTEIFNQALDIFFVTNGNFLVFGTWKILLANAKDGKLVILSVFRRRKATTAFAFYSKSEGTILERTKTFHQFVLETDFLQQANFSLVRVWVGTWRNHHILVRADEWVLFDKYRFPILVLCLRGTGKFVSSEPDQNSLGSLRVSPNTPLPGNGFANRVESLLITNSVKTGSPLTRSCSSNRGVYRRTIRKYNRSYLMALSLTLVGLFSLSMILNLVTVTNIASQNFQLNTDIAEMQALRMRTNSITSSIRSKELFLLNNNYTVFCNETKSRADLEKIGLQLGEMAGYLKGNASRQTGEFREMLLEPVLPYWVHEVDTFNLRHLSLVNLMLEMASRASILAVTPLANITATNSDFLTLYRNGVFEAVHAFNHSVAVFADQRNAQRSEIDRNMQALVISAVILLVVIAVGITVPLFVLIDRNRRVLWQLIMKIPRHLIAEMLTKVNMRLESLHEETDSDSMAGDLAQYTLANNQYYISPVMKKLIVALVIYTVFQVLSVYFVYYIGVSANANVLLHKPKYIHWAGLRRASPWMTLFYMRESYLPYNLSHPALVLTAQKDFHSPDLWKTSLDEIEYVHYCLTYGCPDNGLGTIFLSNDMRNLLLGTPCTNCTALGRYGLTPLIGELIATEKAASTLFQGKNKTYSLGKAAEKAVSAMATYLADAVNLYDIQTLNMLKDAEMKSTAASAAFIIVNFLGLVCGLLPLVAKVKIKQNAKLLKREMEVLWNVQNLETSDTNYTQQGLVSS